MEKEVNGYCVVCYEALYSPTSRANQCPECRGFNNADGANKRMTNKEAEELLQEQYKQGIMPQIDGVPNEDHLEIEEDERYSEEDIYEMFGLSEDDEEEDLYEDYSQ